MTSTAPLPDPSVPVYYAHRYVRPNGRVFYMHASPSRWWVELHGIPEPIVTLRLREREGADPPSPYWGWLDLSHPEKYTMVWPSEMQLEMCFPDGSRGAAEMGRGRKVNLILEEVFAE